MLLVDFIGNFLYDCFSRVFTNLTVLLKVLTSQLEYLNVFLVEVKLCSC